MRAAKRAARTGTVPAPGAAHTGRPAQSETGTIVAIDLKGRAVAWSDGTFAGDRELVNQAEWLTAKCADPGSALRLMLDTFEARGWQVGRDIPTSTKTLDGVVESDGKGEGEQASPVAAEPEKIWLTAYDGGSPAAAHQYEAQLQAAGYDARAERAYVERSLGHPTPWVVTMHVLAGTTAADLPARQPAAHRTGEELVADEVEGQYRLIGRIDDQNERAEYFGTPRSALDEAKQAVETARSGPARKRAERDVAVLEAVLERMAEANDLVDPAADVAHDDRLWQANLALHKVNGTPATPAQAPPETLTPRLRPATKRSETPPPPPEWDQTDKEDASIEADEAERAETERQDAELYQAHLAIQRVKGA